MSAIIAVAPSFREALKNEIPPQGENVTVARCATRICSVIDISPGFITSVSTLKTCLDFSTSISRFKKPRLPTFQIKTRSWAWTGAENDASGSTPIFLRQPVRSASRKLGHELTVWIFGGVFYKFSDPAAGGASYRPGGGVSLSP
jgi:hypothetical protein